MIWKMGCAAIFKKPVEEIIFFRLIKNALASAPQGVATRRQADGS